MFIGEFLRVAINYIFIKKYYDFFNELYSPVYLNRFFEININKSFKIKFALIDAEIRE